MNETLTARDAEAIFAAEGYHGPHDLSPEAHAAALTRELEQVRAREAQAVEALRRLTLAVQVEARSPNGVGVQKQLTAAYNHALDVLARLCEGSPAPVTPEADTDSSQ